MTANTSRSSVVRSDREWRALMALAVGPVPRESLDALSGSSNSPQIVSGLRKRGVRLLCTRVPCTGIDGRTTLRGVYALARDSLPAVRELLRLGPGTSARELLLAQWGLFFRELGMAFEYRPGAGLDDPEWQRPSFRLHGRDTNGHDFEFFAEVVDGALTAEGQARAQQFCAQTFHDDRDVIILNGAPAARAYPAVFRDGESGAYLMWSRRQRPWFDTEQPAEAWAAWSCVFGEPYQYGALSAHGDKTPGQTMTRALCAVCAAFPAKGDQ